MNNKVKQNLMMPILLVILLIVPLFDLFHPGLPITHDGQDHVARIANFYQNLQDGNLIPRWAANLNFGYGHPILMFLYPLPSYMASLFHFLGFSFVDSTKLVFGISFVLSGLTMYLWLRVFLSGYTALIGGLLYTLAPYRFIDLYVRGALGEHVAFIFPPLVLYFIYKLSKKPSYWYLAGGSLSLTGLILAHNAISLMFLPIILFYIVYLGFYCKNKKYFMFQALCLMLLGFGLAAFFWMPAFLEGKYTLRDIVTRGVTLERFVSLKDLFYGPWSYGISGQFTVQIGLLNWLGVFLSIPLSLYFFKKKNSSWIIIFAFLLLFIFIAYLMTSGAKPIWEMVTLLQKFQFPWRFLSLSVFLSAVLGAFVVSILSKNLQKIISILFIIAILFTNKEYWHANSYQQKPESFYSGIYNRTTDTGESSPIWSIRFMESLPKAHIEVLEGSANIKEGKRTSTKHEFIISATQKTKLRENTLYFPGWQILVDGKSVPIEFQDQNSRGIMTFLVEKGEHEVTVEFTETKLRLLSNFVSLASLLILLTLGILNKKLWRN
jgi:uncharacterized membrane protein